MKDNFGYGKIILIVLIFLFFITLSGCADSLTIAPAVKDTIKTTVINIESGSNT